MILATADASLAVEKTAEEAAQEVSRLIDGLPINLTSIISFGIKVLLAFVLFCVGRLIIKWIRKIVNHSLTRSSADKGVVQFIDSVLKFSLYALLIFIIATRLGVESSSVAALIASGGVAIGLALQGSLSNFAGGVLILLLKPFSVGDYIIEDNHKNEGTVKEIQIFYTKLSTLDNKTIVIPNGTLANNSLTNVTARPVRQLDLKIGISYDTDLKNAKRVLEFLLKRDSCILKDEDMQVFVDSLGDSSITLGVRAWVKTEEYWPTRWRLLEEIKLTFDEEGIEIPFKQLSVHISEKNG